MHIQFEPVPKESSESMKTIESERKELRRAFCVISKALQATSEIHTEHMLWYMSF